MQIGQILKTKPLGVSTAQPEDTLQEVATQLAQRRIGAIVIVGESGKVVGIISKRDIFRLVAAHGARTLSMPVSSAMTREVKSCSRSNTVDEIMEMMTRGRFRHLPVIEDDSLVGIVSIGDVVKHHISEVELEVSVMRDYMSG